MAGGKETPRQKMIGMMYLVLTALLALQVSSAIIQKFKFLDDSLQFANKGTLSNNVITEKKIEKAVADGGGKDKPVVDMANKVRKETDDVLKYLNDVRTKLIDISGGWEDPATKKDYKGAKEETAIEVHMIGPEGSKKGEAYKMKDVVNKYAKSLEEITKDEALGKAICLDAKDNPMYKDDPEQRAKDFAQINFAQTPMVAALAVISTIQADVLKRETQALEDLAAKVGASDLKFDQVTATYTAKSGVVAAGTDYEADLFISASSSALRPTMKYNGKEIKVENGKGKIKFRASGGNYDKDGNSKQKGKGEITISNKGKDTTFKVDIEYIVARPVIQIQSASVQALYRNCGNELNVQVPTLGSTYNPSFTASGAKVVKGAQKGIVTLIPTGSKVTLNVASGGTNIGSQDFKVRLIPKPEMVALSNGKPVDEKQGMAAPGPRSIYMKAEPDESFKAFLPKDARYRVAEWEAILVRGKRPVSTQRFNSEMGNCAPFAAQAQPGDRILIEVKKVIRINFLNETENVSLGTIIKNIPLH